MDKLNALLAGSETGRENILPFMWVHGEPEETIREYMGVIQAANIGAVCVESRPHPDFAGPGWWRDMDIIIDEAGKRGMKVWILDDSHFPTGYANGALEDAGPELCRQSLVYKVMGEASQGEAISLSLADCEKVPDWAPNMMEQHTMRDIRTFEDDRLLGVAAVKMGGGGLEDILDLTAGVQAGRFTFTAPPGRWKVYAMSLTRNRGPHRSYINMMSRQSCRVLIDAVYEAHWQHYSADFGKTIAGFFSDEPEIGNGHLYESGKRIWELDDQAWSAEIEEELRARLGGDFIKSLPLIWERDFEGAAAARARRAYMDAATSAVRRDFSLQIGDWCREHGVEYIGHLIEDNNQHLRTGSSLGHYFRGLWGQDMAGIDDIGGQVLPQGEEAGPGSPLSGERNGPFYHFVLGKLGSSLAALDEKKRGRCMCELFGAYGWSEGVRLEKYLCDHFLVRGVNRFVPHAFSLKDFPDPDCPPHFYAHGHNPQYRHFGALMGYLGRMSALLSGGKVVAPAAILYNAEADWMGESDSLESVARPLCEAQIDYTFVPVDALADPEEWRTSAGPVLAINGRNFQALAIPGCDYLPEELGDILHKLVDAGLPVYFSGRQAKGFEWIPAVESAELPAILRGLETVHVEPSSSYIRAMHYSVDGGDIFMLVNEAAQPYIGSVTLPASGDCHAYNAWDNRLEALDARPSEGGTIFSLTLEPLKSLVVVFGRQDGQPEDPVRAAGTCLELSSGWRRSICRSIEYPAFREETAVCLPDKLCEEQPLFSGFVRYERELEYSGAGRMVLEVTDAYEGMEVFVNGKSLGIQVVPTFLYDMTPALKAGLNQLRIEVATTLERETSTIPDQMRMYLGLGPAEPDCPSGINGAVRIWT